MKECYLNTVSEIFGRLAKAIEQFKAGEISVREFQVVIRKAWQDKPKDYMLVDSEIAELFELDESLVGQVVLSEEFEGPMERAYAEDMVWDIIAAVPDWKKTGDSYGMASVRGSNSLIQNVIGHAEWMHFAFSR